MSVKLRIVLRFVSVMVLGFGCNACGLLAIGSSPTPQDPHVTPFVNPPEDVITDTEDKKKEVSKLPPTAMGVPGRPGYVFNPFTGNVVDVRGLKAGLLVRDPQDKDLTHSFRVPVFE